MNTIYFVDFDHTIARRDVWDTVVRHFAEDAWQEWVGRYVRGEVSSRECNQALAQRIPPRPTEAAALIREVGLDPTFADFYAWLEARGLPMQIVSDGYDYYIDLLLREAGLPPIPRYSNALQWTEEGIQVRFPYSHADCERDMAHCKCQRVYEAQGMRRVYIGDGISDYCAARRCERIYAKRNLLQYCQDQGIPHVPFDNFHEIIQCEMDWFARRDRPEAPVP